MQRVRDSPYIQLEHALRGFERICAVTFADDAVGQRRPPSVGALPMRNDNQIAKLAAMRQRLNNAIASFRIEGIEPTPAELAELELVVSGQISASELTARIIAGFQRAR